MKTRVHLLLFPLLLMLFMSSCTVYTYRSIVYNVPGINDYKILPTRAVKHSGTPKKLSAACDYNTCTLPDTLQDLLTQTKTVAFLVMRRDSVVYEWYKDGYSDSSTTNPFSVTTSIVGVLTGIALKEGKIKSLDEPIYTYYPEFKGRGRDSITFRHLLTMTSGLNYHDQYINPFGPLARLYYGRNVKKQMNHSKRELSPGTQWRYKNSDPQVLTLALENAVGMNMSDYATEKLWKPIGAEHDALWIVDKKNEGTEKSYCCLHTNAHDLAKVAMLYKYQGNVDGVQIVDTSYIKESLTPVNVMSDKGKLQNRYGYLWWLNNVDGIGDFSMEGLSGQYVAVIPSQDLVFVRLGEKDFIKPGTRFSGCQLYRRVLRSVVAKWGTNPNYVRAEGEK
ncbi:MAG: beta-lactamase family protein [Bacteroidetes bacterium]|nr:beta-lactamase family protein [Bacteroidota bacterium]